MEFWTTDQHTAVKIGQSVGCDITTLILYGHIFDDTLSESDN